MIATGIELVNAAIMPVTAIYHTYESDDGSRRAHSITHDPPEQL
jgi:hypothetical protein